MVIATKEIRQSRKWARLPTHYKVDIGSKSSRLCIECDGPSHRCMKVKQADQKKDAFFHLIGYRVLRFSNEAILNWISLGMPMDAFISTTLLRNGIKLSVWTGC
jgi:very-short-patch-repair endonuclease